MSATLPTRQGLGSGNSRCGRFIRNATCPGMPAKESRRHLPACCGTPTKGPCTVAQVAWLSTPLAKRFLLQELRVLRGFRELRAACLNFGWHPQHYPCMRQVGLNLQSCQWHCSRSSACQAPCVARSRMASQRISSVPHNPPLPEALSCEWLLGCASTFETGWYVGEASGLHRLNGSQDESHWL